MSQSPNVQQGSSATGGSQAQKPAEPPQQTDTSRGPFYTTERNSWRYKLVLLVLQLIFMEISAIFIWGFTLDVPPFTRYVAAPLLATVAVLAVMLLFGLEPPNKLPRLFYVSTWERPWGALFLTAITVSYVIILMFLSLESVFRSNPLRTMAWAFLTLLATLAFFVTFSGPKYWNMGWYSRLRLTAWAVLAAVLTPLLVVLVQRGVLSLQFAQIIIVGFLVAMYGLNNPRLFWSRTRVHLRTMFSDFRHDPIRTDMSPTIDEIHVFNRIGTKMRGWISRVTGFRIAFFAVLAFAILMPFAMKDIFTAGTPYSPVGYIGLVILLGFLATLVVFVYWLLETRDRYVVMPFIHVASEPHDDQPSEAHLVTQTFVEELQQIRRLLQHKQIELADIGADTGLAMFVTSGGDQDLMQQFQSLRTLSILADMNLPFGQLLAMLIARLARATIHGYIQHKSDGSIEIWADLWTRVGQIESIGRVVLHPETVGQVDDRDLRQKAKDLAIFLTLKFGDSGHFAHSPDSLTLFLDGLAASQAGNWWTAISNYRRAIHIEETEFGTFGLGHYHLGAALLFQGEYKTGLEHLRLARLNGPPMAETHYMVALASLYDNAANLDRDEFFDEIDHMLVTACHLRPDYPQMYHIRGMIYYLRGRLREERHPPGSMKVLPETHTYADALKDYEAAERYLRKGLSQYRRAYRRSKQLSQENHLGMSQDHLRIMADMMAATHRLADALRSQTLYSEADSYYDDVIEAYPGNIPTLTDRAKTYCLSHNWQRGYEYLSERLLKRDQAYWQPEANLYMAWTQLGGMLVEPGVSYNQALSLLTNAFSQMDYALAAQHNLIVRWREMNWLPQFVATVWVLNDGEKGLQDYRGPRNRMSRLFQWDGIETRQRKSDVSDEDLLKRHLPGAKPKDHDALDKAVQASNDLSRPLGQLRWIAWRAASLGTVANNDSILRWVEPSLAPDNQALAAEATPGKQQADPYTEAYRTLREVREQVAKLFYDKVEEKQLLFDMVEEKRLLSSLEFRLKNLQYAQTLHGQWVTLKTFLEDNFQKGLYDFKSRSAVDTYLEIVLLAARMFVEGGEYTWADQMIGQTLKDIDDWLAEVRTALDKLKQTSPIQGGQGATNDSFNMWHIQSIKDWLNDSRSTGGSEHTLLPAWLSPKVLTFQITALRAWQAHARYKACFDETTPAVDLDLGTYDRDNLKNRSEIWKLTKSVLQVWNLHPLGTLTHANVMDWKGSQGTAIDKLLELLDAYSAFDPHVYIASWSRRHRTGLGEGEAHFNEFSGGLKQFVTFTDRASLHYEIAQLFKKIGKLELALRHIQTAIVWSPYVDRDASYFREMADILDQLGRTEEALAALQEAKVRFNLEEWSSRAQRRGARLFETYLLVKLDKLRRASEILGHIRDLRDFDADLKKLGIPADFREPITDQLNTQFRLRNGRLSPQAKWQSIARTHQDFAKYFGSMPGAEGNTKRKGLAAGAQQPFDLMLAMKRHIFKAIADEAWELIRQQAMISNNIAFLGTRLSADLETSKQLSEESLQIFCSVIDGLPRNFLTSLKSLRAPIATSRTTQPLGTVHDLINPLRDRRDYTVYCETFATLLDTLGWLHYRMGDPDRAIGILEAAACLNSTLSDLHYHLARAYIGKVDAIWRKRPQAADADILSACLLHSEQHWQLAQRLDSSGQLRPDLNRLRHRITQYKERWDRVQLKLGRKSLLPPLK